MNFKKSIIALAIASTFGVSANATGNQHSPHKPPEDSPTIRVTSSSEAEATSEARSNAESESHSEASANSGGNVLSSRVIHKGVRSAAGAFTSAGDTTAECQGDKRGGISLLVGGISYGKSFTIKDCVLANAAENELALGNLAASIKLRCRISFYQEALGEDCEALLNTQDGSGRTRAELRPAARTETQRKADREKLLQEVSK